MEDTTQEGSGGIGSFILSGAYWSILDNAGRYASTSLGWKEANAVLPYTHFINGSIGFGASVTDAAVNTANTLSKPFTKGVGFLKDKKPGVREAWNNYSTNNKIKFGNFESMSTVEAKAKNEAAQKIIKSKTAAEKKAAREIIKSKTATAAEKEAAKKVIKSKTVTAAKKEAAKKVMYQGGIGIMAEKITEKGAKGFLKKAAAGVVAVGSEAILGPLALVDIAHMVNDAVVDIEQSGKLNSIRSNTRLDNSNLSLGSSVQMPYGNRSDLKYLKQNPNIASSILNSTFGG